jgi:hypothetical protein
MGPCWGVSKPPAVLRPACEPFESKRPLTGLLHDAVGGAQSPRLNQRVESPRLPSRALGRPLPGTPVPVSQSLVGDPDSSLPVRRAVRCRLIKAQ